MKLQRLPLPRACKRPRTRFATSGIKPPTRSSSLFSSKACRKTKPPLKYRNNRCVPAHHLLMSMLTNLVQLSVTFPLPNGSDFTFDLDPLCHPVNPTTSTYKILSTKVEFTLTKREPGRKWATLESTTANPAAATATTAPEPAKEAAPAYPTSARSGPKNWDKV